MKKEGTPRTVIPMLEEYELWRMDFTKKLSIADEGSALEVLWGLLLGIYQMGIPTT
jgi:hypothetical protein